MVEIKFHGMKQIEGNLKILREGFDVRTGGIIMRGLREGAKVVQAEAKARAPVLGNVAAYRSFKARQRHLAGTKFAKGEVERVPRNIKSNIVVQMVPIAKSGGNPTVWVRVRTRRGYILDKAQGNRLANLINNPIYWWLLEFGTSKMAARPFMRPAFESKKAHAVQLAINYMRTEINTLFQKFGVLTRYGT